MTPLRPTALAPALRTEADAAPPASDARVRECNVCPPIVRSCAHYDGRYVILHGSPFHHGINIVCVGASPALFFRGEHGYDDAHEQVHNSHDYDAALRAFRDAEMRLLQGEEAGR